ncbi:hypothetical protein J6590_064061 [Homalodisca vitripennis]|nr:hypothetical protein J6590_064061 [Homalodisca vitripennis]
MWEHKNTILAVCHCLVTGSWQFKLLMGGTLLAEDNFLLQELLDEPVGVMVSCSWPGLIWSTCLGVFLTAYSLPRFAQLGLPYIYTHSSGSTQDIAFGTWVRQGCLRSPLLFSLVMETLIRQLVALYETGLASCHMPMTLLQLS